MNVHVFDDGRLMIGELSCRCALGRAGAVEALDKTEGDGGTPLGSWPIRKVLYRADRVAAPLTQIPIQAIEPNDGWCDDPADPRYNMPIKLPYPASAEEMWREDHIYNLVVVLGYNDDPVISAKGSAIFWHLARPDFEATLGCVAVLESDMRAALKLISPDSVMQIARAKEG